MIAALFVATDGVYFGLRGVDPWDKARDARVYNGNDPVVAHPPCERWGRYWGGGPSAKIKRTLGADEGCFAAAVASVRRCGGVLEHPEASHAFAHYGLRKPAWREGWVEADDGMGYVCCVAQGHYGHRARKLTWLYAVSAAERASKKTSVAPKVNATRLCTRENLSTPIPFRDLLLRMARSAR